MNGCPAYPTSANCRDRQAPLRPRDRGRHWYARTMASPRWLTVLFLTVAVPCPSALASPEPETTLACVQPNVAAEGSDVFLACGRGTSVLVGRGANGSVLGPLEPLGTLESLA